MITGDTIAAISSAAGSAARMIVRVSGPRAWQVATGLCPDAHLAPGAATSARLRFRGMTLSATLYSFRGPRSYSGEDLVEFHLPGNPLLARMILDEVVATGGTRLAEPGEFTARAYFHGRINLTEAEGVAAMISAHSEEELRAARQLLAGELARRLRPVMDLMAETLALIEVGIDFSEEDVTFLPAAEVAARLERGDAMLSEIVEHSARFERLAHEPRAALVGRPNAGKSTLLNALARRPRAVVSPIAGTTRDVLSAEVALERGMLQLVDVAGIDDSIPCDEIGRQMRDHALRELQTADLVLLVHDGSSRQSPMPLDHVPDLIVMTKGDLRPGAGIAGVAGIHVSAVTGENLDALRHRLDELAFGSRSAGAVLALNARHLQAISSALAALARAAAIPNTASELLALELREALDELGRIVGSISPDELLGRIFSTFCIGK
jgi:tRNA modification GTPase